MSTYSRDWGMGGANIMKPKLAVEFIGTFFLSLTICLAAAHGLAGELAPFAIASILMVLIYSGAHVSGAHYNPVVTISIWIRGASEKSEVFPYILAQLFGGALAALVTSNLIITGSYHEEFPLDSFDPTNSQTSAIIICEMLFTFALVFVILNVATSERNQGNGYFGVAISFVVLAGALTVGSISLASFNPAVTTSLIILGKMSLGDIWLHLTPQLIGGISAAYLFIFIED